MTRPSENMILALMDSTVICLIPKKRGESFRRVKEKTYEKSLTWLDKIYGEDKQDDSSLSSLHSSLKTRFLERCPSVEKPAPLLATEYTTMYKPKTVEAGNVRNQQPSLYVTDKPFVATNPVSVSTPIPIKGEVKPDTFGDCIHQIFCDMAHHPSLSTKHSSLFTLHLIRPLRVMATLKMWTRNRYCLHGQPSAPICKTTMAQPQRIGMSGRSSSATMQDMYSPAVSTMSVRPPTPPCLSTSRRMGATTVAKTFLMRL